MSHSSKLGLIIESIKRSTHRSSQNLHNYVRTKRDNFLSKPVISTLNSSAQYLVSAENIENVKMKYDETYHWVAGTEVTEVQERARELESKLNVKRKNMLEVREQMDNVNERLRGIVVELENTRRGDPKHLHLRQLEYDTIQEEMKLSKQVQKTEFEERETFTWLMNAVRESHETERNYNQRIKMLSLIGAALGPFIGYMFSARLNAMRFRRMEEIINKKLELLSFTTLINAIREIHGLEPEVMSDSEKQNFISRILSIFYTIQSSLIEAFNIAVTASSDLLESIQEEPEVEAVIADVVAEKPKTSQVRKVVADTKPQTKDASTQVTTSMPVERIIVEKIISQEVDYANLPEFKSLMGSLKTIEEKQDNLKQLLITSQELQEASKIEVSVNSSDDEIISILQADQQMVRKILLSVSDLLQDSRTSLGATLDSIVSNIESLSMKITNNSELYVGNLEHSKIINDIVKSLDDVKSNIDTIETYYMNDVNKQLTELTNIHGDLSTQIDGVKQDLEMQLSNLDKVNDSLVNGFNMQDRYASNIGDVLDGITDLLGDIEADKSVDSVIDKVDQVTDALAEMRTLLETLAETSGEKLDGFENIISDNIDKTLQRFEENILSQYQNRHDALIEKIDEISIPPPTVIYTTDSATETVPIDVDDVEKIISDNLDKTLQKFEENILSQYQNRHDALLEKIDEISIPPPTIIYTRNSGTETEPQDVEVVSESAGFPEEILDDSQLQLAQTEEEKCIVSAVDEIEAQSRSTVSQPDESAGFPEENLDESLLPPVQTEEPSHGEIFIVSAVDRIEAQSQSNVSEPSDSTDIVPTDPVIVVEETSGSNSESEETVQLLASNDDSPAEFVVLPKEADDGFADTEIPSEEEISNSSTDLAILSAEAPSDDGTSIELPISIDPTQSKEGEISESTLEDVPSDPIQNVPMSMTDVVTAPASVIEENVPDEVMSSDPTSADNDSSIEPVGYPGAVEEKRSSVYLYGVFVAVSTVIMYFFK